MASRYYSDFKERKVSGAGGGTPQSKGKARGEAGTVSEHTASWPGLPGKPSSANYNRATKCDTVKIHPMKQGMSACANVGQTRKITSVGATTAVATVPFLNDIAVGDQFIIVPWCPGDTAGDNVQTTTLITQARQNIAVGTGADIRPVEVEFDFSSVSNAQRNSYVYGRLVNHIMATGT